MRQQLAMLALLAAWLTAQTPTGQVSGQVQDPAGASIPAVTAGITK